MIVLVCMCDCVSMYVCDNDKVICDDEKDDIVCVLLGE